MKKHSFYLDIIKRMLNASYVSWTTDKNTKGLKIIVNKKEHFLPFGGGELITEQSYLKLIREIQLNENAIRESLQVS